MEIEILGAHMTEMAGAKPTAMVIDGVLLMPAASAPVYPSTLSVSWRPSC